MLTRKIDDISFLGDPTFCRLLKETCETKDNIDVLDCFERTPTRNLLRIVSQYNTHFKDQENIDWDDCQLLRMVFLELLRRVASDQKLYVMSIYNRLEHPALKEYFKNVRDQCVQEYIEHGNVLYSLLKSIRHYFESDRVIYYEELTEDDELAQALQLSLSFNANNINMPMPVKLEVADEEDAVLQEALRLSLSGNENEVATSTASNDHDGIVMTELDDLSLNDERFCVNPVYSYQELSNIQRKAFDSILDVIEFFNHKDELHHRVREKMIDTSIKKILDDLSQRDAWIVNDFLLRSCDKITIHPVIAPPSRETLTNAKTNANAPTQLEIEARNAWLLEEGIRQSLEHVIIKQENNMHIELDHPQNPEYGPINREKPEPKKIPKVPEQKILRGFEGKKEIGVPLKQKRHSSLNISTQTSTLRMFQKKQKDKTVTSVVKLSARKCLR